MVLADLGQLFLLTSVPVAAFLIGYGVFRKVARKPQPLRRIAQRLETLAGQAGQIEIDLTQLQLQDAHGVLSQGWNRLVAEVAEARRELEALQVRRQALETVGRYHAAWMTDLLNKMPYGLLMVGDDLGVTFANTSAERLLGRRGDELVGRKITEIFDDSLEYLRTPAGSMLDRTFSVQTTGATVRLKAARTLAQGGGAQTALFLQDTSHLKEARQARDRFLYHITHELRTPLTNIRAYAETLSEGVLEDRDSLRECYNVIIGETERLSRLVEDVLSVSQLEAGSARLVVDDVQMARLLRQVVEDMQASADEKNVELILSLPPKVPTIRGDKDRLTVVLTNLVGNAVKYTPAGGHVEVTCEEDGARLQIRVRDTGIGIAPEDQPRVFEKFYRAQNEEVARIPGTGLGLAIAQETVRAHGGTIELVSELGKGSTFTVTLPIGRSAVVGVTEDE